MDRPGGGGGPAAAAASPRSDRAPRLGLLAALSAVASLALLAALLSQDVLSGDFRATVWQAGRDVLHGRSPYPNPDALGYPSVYPPAVILAALPLALLPFAFAAFVWGLVLSLGAALFVWTLRITDRALLLLVATSLPVVTSVLVGNITLLVVLAAAVAWRVRDRPYSLAAVMVFGVMSKLLLLPLLAWLVLTRRLRAFAVTAIAAPALVLASWAVIDFRGFAEYPTLLAALTREYGPEALSLYAALVNLGAPHTAALAATMLGALVVLAAAALVYRGRGDDAGCYALMMVACFAFTPVSWTHNLAFVIVAIALLARPGSALWYAVPAFWLTLPAVAVHAALPAALAVALAAVVAANPLVAGSQRTRLVFRRPATVDSRY